MEYRNRLYKRNRLYNRFNRHWKKLISGILLLFIYIQPVLAYQSTAKDTVPTVGDIAEKLIRGTDFLTRFIIVVCIAIGVTLVISSFTYFRAHMKNPKFAPLDRPLFYLLCGLILIAVPFLGKIFGPTASVFDIKKREERTKIVAPVDIDAPLEFGNEYDH